MKQVTEHADGFKVDVNVNIRDLTKRSVRRLCGIDATKSYNGAH